ncbi:transcriptional activator hac1 [Anaeramoeba flamelloides]|uniref:Transcriptional activator hac1 n=1 Tax=Anaeramoeba flamelloides TaxID=1746091 RepID=A0ABQ8YGF1_9EUKA|nr:transcriptional activator hac1 [Anaeramoeba flamelloides]
MTDIFDLNNNLDFNFDLNETDLTIENSLFENDLLSTIDDESLGTELLLSLQEDFNTNDQKSPINTQQPFNELVDENNFSNEIKEEMSIETDNLEQSNNKIKNENGFKTNTVEKNLTTHKRNGSSSSQKTQKKIKKPNPKPEPKNKTLQTKTRKIQTKTKKTQKTKNQKKKTTNCSKKVEIKKEIMIKKNPKNKGIIIQIKKCRKRTLSDRKSLNGNGKFSVSTQPIWVVNKIGEKVNLLAVMNKYEFNLLTEEQKKKRKLLKNRISAEESRLRARQRLGGLQTKVETLITKNKKLNNIITKIQDEKEEMRREIELLRIKLLNQPCQKHSHLSYEPITKIKRTNTHPVMRSSTGSTNTHTTTNTNTTTNTKTTTTTTSKLFASVRDNAYELFSDLTSINYKSSKPNQKRPFLKEEKGVENFLKVIDDDKPNYNEYQFGGTNSQQTGFSLFIILLVFGLFFQTNLISHSVSNHKAPNQNILNNLSPTISATGSRKVLTISQNPFDSNFESEFENLFFQKDYDHFESNSNYKLSRNNYDFKNHTNYEICVEYNPKYLAKSTIWVK